jgi:exodeoxyribonuclease-1
MKTYFFYDLETSGLDARADRVMQFAGQRTDLELNPIGAPVNFLVRLADDTLPSPYAIMVTKITPQATLADGLSEAEFAHKLQTEIFTPDTIAVGYNSVRFDDEFVRHLFWRNFYDPYEWHWRDGRSRWDLLDVVRMTRALRPDGITWPVDKEGKETNRLELITKQNGIAHESAHDALSDVTALIDVARLIRAKQPQLYEYLFKLRDKSAVLKLVNLDDKQPFVYTSGRYAAEHHKTTVAFPLTAGKNGKIIVYDLRYNPDEVMENYEDSYGATASIAPSRATARARTRYPSDSPFPRSVIKTLAPNRCPAVAPLGVLAQQDGWAKLALDPETIARHQQQLLAHPEFAERVRTDFESRPEFPPAPDPESALYDSFLDDRDRKLTVAIPALTADQLADYHPNFADPRLPDLLLHYKARNFPRALSADEQPLWEAYRRERLAAQAPSFVEALQTLAAAPHANQFLLGELQLYYESVAALE